MSISVHIDQNLMIAHKSICVEIISCCNSYMNSSPCGDAEIVVYIRLLPLWFCHDHCNLSTMTWVLYFVTVSASR